MTDSKKLRFTIQKSGFKYKSIAEKLGISPYGLQKKIDGITDFKAKEICELSKILSLSSQERNSIFFSNNVAE